MEFTTMEFTTNEIMPQRRHCLWSLSESKTIYKTDCQNITPAPQGGNIYSQGYRFCPFCGGELLKAPTGKLEKVTELDKKPQPQYEVKADSEEQKKRTEANLYYWVGVLKREREESEKNANELIELKQQIIANDSLAIKHNIACESLRLCQENRECAQRALAEQCKETKKLVESNNALLTRIQEFDRCIQSIATALGGICCGGVDVDQNNPSSTTAVITSAIHMLHWTINNQNVSWSVLEKKLIAAEERINAPYVMSNEHMLLGKFYGVSDLVELADAQARHIEKLIAKLPNQWPSPSQKVREG